MKFNYQARNKKGQVQSGVVEASSREAAINLLQKHGLYVTILEETAAPPIYAKRIKIFERVSDRELVLFSRQLSILFKSKVSLVEALQVLAVQNDNASFREKIFKLAEDVEAGTSLSGALSRYPQIFSSFYIAMIKAGETSGKLSEALSYLANHLEREYHLTSRIKGALLYPALIVIVAIVVVALMIFFVIPQLTEVLVETGGELPVITKIVISVSNFFKNWGWTVLLGIIALILAISRYRRTKEGKRFFDNFYLQLPFISPVLKMVYLARFAENLSTLISGGLPIAQALETTGDIVDNTVYKEIIFKTRDEVRRGEAISAVLSRFPEAFPPIFTQMALVGERTGTLDKTLMNLVEFYQEEVDRTISNLLSVLEPVLIVLLGIVVAGLMAAVLMPLYRMAGI
jgi:type II secretory pathway component PulF